MTGPLSSLEALRGLLAGRAPRRVNVPDAIQAAVSVVLTPGDDGLELLLIRRSEREGDPWSGHMGLPGGRRDGDDPDLVFTAMRETLEETSIDLSPDALLGGLDDLHPTTTTLPRIVVRPYVFGVVARPDVVPNHEVAGHLWTSITALDAARAESEVVHNGAVRTVPSFRLGEHVVWGITHRILTPLTDLAPG